MLKDYIKEYAKAVYFNFTKITTLYMAVIYIILFED